MANTRSFAAWAGGTLTAMFFGGVGLIATAQPATALTITPFFDTKACRQLSQIEAAARWRAARKFLAVLS